MAFVPRWAREAAVLGLELSALNTEVLLGLIPEDVAKGMIIALRQRIKELPQ